MSTSTARPMKVKPPRRPGMGIGNRGTLPHSSTVLLLVDFINPLEFPEAEHLAAPALKAARAAARLKQRMVDAGCLVIYANDNYGQWRSDFRDTLAHCLSQDGPAGTMARLLAPSEADLVMLKPRHSAFYATPLDLVLTQTRTELLVVAGLATDICVQLTAMDANLHGYGIWVPKDCTAAEQPAEKSRSLEYMQRVLRADVRSSTTRQLPRAPKAESAGAPR